MDIRQLRYLVYTARYSSFRIAADKLNATQPAVSKGIRVLEQSVGVRLLDRGPWGVKPTEYGERLIQYGEALLALTEEARTEIDAMLGAKRGRLRVGSLATTVRGVVPTAARRFLEKSPEVDLTFYEELSPALQAQLLKGSIDVAVMSRPQDFPDDELEYRDLLNIPMQIVADVAHPLMQRERLSLSDLKRYQWILPARPDPDRLALDSLFSKAQLPLPKAVCETTSSRFQVSMLAGTTWLSYLTTSSAYTSDENAQLARLPLPSPAWTRSVGVAYRKQRVSRPIVDGFLRELEIASAEFTASMEEPR